MLEEDILSFETYKCAESRGSRQSTWLLNLEVFNLRPVEALALSLKVKPEEAVKNAAKL